jgi:hypothetical protein
LPMGMEIRAFHRSCDAEIVVSHPFRDETAEWMGHPWPRVHSWRPDAL